MRDSSLDEYAWKVITAWHEAAGFDPVHKGVDFNELTRFFLWARVGNALRSHGIVRNCSNACPDEEPAADTAGSQRFGIRSLFSAGIACRNRLQTFLEARSRKHAGKRTGAAKTVVFAPFIGLPLRSLIVSLAHDDSFFLQGFGTEPFFNMPAALKPAGPVTVEPKFLGDLLHALLDGLAHHGVRLQQEDIPALKKDIFSMKAGLERAGRELVTIQPDFILLQADNYPPRQYYVLLGRLLGIPSVVVQHGLDCERHYLDTPYADMLFVWGDERKRRYEAHRTGRAVKIYVSGSPEYAAVTPEPEISTAGDYWLWVTRPHAREKCLAPSRYENEGLDILKALAGLLEKYAGQSLVIKPHPYDTIDAYRDFITSNRLDSRISISGEPPLELAQHAALVFTEDSTAGLEAVLRGRPLVHVHFASSEPVMPFVQYGTALPGFSREQLEESVDMFMNGGFTFNNNDREVFLHDFLGPTFTVNPCTCIKNTLLQGHCHESSVR